jgi:putative nucleotidyltransferase with HDIG domain
MRTQFTSGELDRLSPREPGLHAHCERVRTLASEIGNSFGIPYRSAVFLQQASLLHHSPELLRDNALDWLVADIFNGNGDSSRRMQTPEGLRHLLQAFHCFPRRSRETKAELLPEILALANLIDEWIEGEMNYGDLAQPLWDSLEGVRELFRDELWARARSLFPASLGDPQRNWEIPMQPEVAHHLRSLLTHSSSYSLSRLAKIASQDPAIAGRLIQAANSPLFHAGTRIRSVQHALTYLGENASRKIITGLIARSMFGSNGALVRLWRHSLRTAEFLENLARAKGLMEPSEALLMGLVHDVGRIAIQRQKEAAMYARLIEPGCPATWSETLLFGVDHAELGARILASWRFPESMVAAVRFHHRPAESDSVGAAALYAAEFWSESDEDLPSLRQLRTALSRIGCAMEELSPLDALDAASTALLKIA